MAVRWVLEKERKGEEWMRELEEERKGVGMG